MRIKTFQDIYTWKKGYKLTLKIYEATKNFPKSEAFGLKSQLRRAAVSCISNIAEGFKRLGAKDSLHFYNYSQASLEEIKCQAMPARDLNYFDQPNWEAIEQLADEAGKTLHGWIKSQKYL